jgi:hypothetical protein
MQSSFLVTVEHSRPIPDLCDLVAQRAWNIDGVNVSSPRGAVTARAVQARPLERGDVISLISALTAAPTDEGKQALLEKFLATHGGGTPA